MKFTNGFWLMRQGTMAFSPVEVHDLRKEEDRVVITAPTRHITDRGDTLGGVTLSVEITAPMEHMLRVRLVHFKGVAEKGPCFELNLENKVMPELAETDTHVIVSSGNLSIEIDKRTFGMRYLWEGNCITEATGRDISYIKTDFKGLPYDDGSGRDTYMRVGLGIGVGEHIYGLGEHFTPFIKNGQTVDIWNEDGGTSSEQGYKNIPFYISDRGYGVFVDRTEKVSFEVGSETVTKVNFSVPGENISYIVIGGPTMKDVLRRYTDLTGKPGLPAPWTFGLWLSTSFTTNYDEATVNSFVDGMLDRGIPLKVFHFDCFWMKEYAWCNFKWDPDTFPDPAGMLARLKKKGIKICVWINPYIGQASELFDEGMEGGYLLKRPSGDVWQWDLWQPGMAIVDFTNPKAREWYASKLEALLDMGVDCFKTDFGERIPTNCVYADGSDPVKMHNFYTYLYNKTVYEVLLKKRGRNEAVLFARSATAGGQKFPVHWGGDCYSDFVSMEESLRGGLSLCMSGFGFWSHDIGGFEDTSTADVYKRWCAFGLLSTHSRLHGSSSYRVPWNYDDEAVDVVRRFAKLKASLMPYLYRNAVVTSETGIPMMRSMVLEFTEDPTAAYLDRQYMLGDSLLVAPVLSEDGTCTYYLPKGRWTSLLTGEEKQGGTWYTETFDYMSLPLYVRPGSIIPIGACDTDCEYEYADGVTYRVYPMEDGETASFEVHQWAEEVTGRIVVTRDGDSYKVEVTSGKPCTVELVGTGIAPVTFEAGGTKVLS